MEDAAFETRRAKRLKRHSRIKAIGLSLLGLVMLAIIAGWLTPVIISARESVRWRHLQTMPYPDRPTKPGVFTLETEPHPSFGGTILFTPPMPVQFDAVDAQRNSGPVWFEVRDFIEGTTRVDPVKQVLIYFTPLPWAVHGARVLTIDADGETIDLTCGGDMLVFDVPTEFFVRMVAAKRMTAVLDGTPFTVTPDEQAALRDFAAYLKPGIEVRPPE